ncbi:TBC1 domain family member 10B [Hyperolius riggenbachi]|uniref:TBC1 domain family member 10B n=1 Tax=Hyperolius riggenbachi TaxID=752182 RepID=UPI0035A31003
MERPPGPCHSPPGPRPVPPPRRGSMERRSSRDTPEKRPAVTQTVTIVMEGRSALGGSAPPLAMDGRPSAALGSLGPPVSPPITAEGRSLVSTTGPVSPTTMEGRCDTTQGSQWSPVPTSALEGPSVAIRGPSQWNPPPEIQGSPVPHLATMQGHSAAGTPQASVTLTPITTEVLGSAGPQKFRMDNRVAPNIRYITVEAQVNPPPDLTSVLIPEIPLSPDTPHPKSMPPPYTTEETQGTPIEDTGGPPAPSQKQWGVIANGDTPTKSQGNQFLEHTAPQDPRTSLPGDTPTPSLRYSVPGDPFTQSQEVLRREDTTRQGKEASVQAVTAVSLPQEETIPASELTSAQATGSSSPRSMATKKHLEDAPSHDFTSQGGRTSDNTAIKERLAQDSTHKSQSVEAAKQEVSDAVPTPQDGSNKVHEVVVSSPPYNNSEVHLTTSETENSVVPPLESTTQCPNSGLKYEIQQTSQPAMSQQQGIIHNVVIGEPQQHSAVLNVAAPPEDINPAKKRGTTLPDGASQSSAAQNADTLPQEIMVHGPAASPQQQKKEQDETLPSVSGPKPGELNSSSQVQTNNPSAQQPSPQLAPVGTSVSPIRSHDPSSPHRSMSSKPPLPVPPRSSLYPGHPPSIREHEPSLSYETASLSSFRSKAPAPDTLSYLDSVSLMSGTLESLTHLDDASSLGSDSEINGMPYRKTDKYGFLGGNQFSGLGEGAIPVEIARQRELKWLDMFNHWDKWLTRRFQKVKLRCRKGIPSSLRARAWQFLSNSHDLLSRNPGKFEEMERQPGDPKWLDVIEKDLHRQFPFHEMFAARGGHGQQDLYRILKAYTVYRPEEGYCQAQAPVAAVLLMHMPAEQAFWCLVQICDKYLPGYYSAGLEAIQLDGEIFFALLRRVCPNAYRHLKKFKIDPILYMTEWFMCIFSRTLPWSSVLRVWDMFFCEGVKIVFRVGLVLLRHTLGTVDKLRSCQGMYETMEKLRSLPPHCMQEEVLLPEVSSLPVTDALIERESNTQLRKWRENRGELQYRPSRRLHGARQIFEERVRLNPTLSGSRLSISSLRKPSPPSTPSLTLKPESVVVSEGLRPALPSPTANKAPLGPPKELPKKVKEKQKEQDKKKEREDREREKKKEKEEREKREREQRKDKEREKQKEKEDKRMQKEKEKAESKQKKERKFSFRRKETSSSATESPRKSGSGPTDSSVAHDTYF